MKKILLVALVALLAISGCKKEEEEFTFSYVEDTSDYQEALNDIANQKTDEEKDIKTVSSKDTSTDLGKYVGEQYSKSGTISISFEETDSYDVEYGYLIPGILDSSETAKSINDEIYAFAKESIDIVEAIDSGTAKEIYEPSYAKITYDAFLNGDVLSLVVVANGSVSDWVEYKIFNYNVSTQEIVSNEELLALAGLDKKQFISNAKKTFGRSALPDLDEYLTGSGNIPQNVSLGEQDAQEPKVDTDSSKESEAEGLNLDDTDWKKKMVSSYIYDYVSTISDKNINENMRMYLDGDGDLCACTLVYVPAGAGQYYQVEKVTDISNKDIFDKYLLYAEENYYPGFEKDCLGLYGVEGFSGSAVHKLTVSKVYSEDTYIGFDSDDESKFTMQFYGSDYSVVYLGTFRFAGLDENGAIYEYELTDKTVEGEPVKTDDAESHSGRFYLKPYAYYDSSKEEYVSGAIYTYIDGDDMFDSDGNNVDFKLSVG